MEKVFIAEYTPEALEQFNDLDIKNQDKILAAIKTFEIIGTKYKNINQLDYGLYEIKPKGIRAYFKYDENRKNYYNWFYYFKTNSKSPKKVYETSHKKY